jgi:monofunctional biosynthetic peptidoglycan transglycosylase
MGQRRVRRRGGGAPLFQRIGAAQLGPEQAAKLAGMVPNPRYYDRNRNAPGLARKTAIILARMPAAEVP